MTNGDGALREVIKEMFPKAIYHLCGWHLYKNAFENVKKNEFIDAFSKTIYFKLTLNHFEAYWKKIVSKYGL